MMEEKHVVEWLRERSQLLRTLGEFSCRDFMTYEFGISSPCTHPRSCRDCYADMFERIADRIDREMMVEKERMKKENAELKAELSDWKGNAEGFQPDAYMKLPLDADGEPIKVGDTVYCDDDPEPWQVDLIYAGSMGYCTVRLKDSAGIYKSADAPRLSHKKPEPPDSWEKLEEDAAITRTRRVTRTALPRATGADSRRVTATRR